MEDFYKTFVENVTVFLGSSDLVTAIFTNLFVA